MRLHGQGTLLAGSEGHHMYDPGVNYGTRAGAKLGALHQYLSMGIQLEKKCLHLCR